MLAVKTVELGKHYTIHKSIFDRFRNKGIKLEALKGISLEIKKGEIFGLLGSNGAGKTTFMNILSTILLPDSGRAEIFGYDVVEQAEEVREIIGLSSAYSEFYHGFKTKEFFKFFSLIYDKTINIKNLISYLDLEKYEDTPYDELSSGNKQKLSVIKSLMNNPKLLLMDELTVALDPRVASDVRKLIRDWRKKNKTTIILTTHNMLEAEELCERVAIIHKGKIVALDAVAKLKKIIKEEDVIEISTSEMKKPKFLLNADGIKRIGFKGSKITVHVDDAENRLEKIIKLLLSRSYHIKSVKIHEPTLEDVFLRLTGVELE